MYTETHVDDVFEAESAPDPRNARETLDDWIEHAILIVAKHTRDTEKNRQQPRRKPPYSSSI